MPELPEVETVCRGLKPIVGAVFTHAKAHRADLRMPLPKQLDKKLVGQKIAAVERRAKYILIRLECGDVLLLHLGMSGRLTLLREDEALKKHDHLSFAFNNGLYARFNDPRRFGVCAFIAAKDIATHKLLRDLGPEPLSDAFDAVFLEKQVEGRNAPIKTTILDQHLVVGIGNIYACESLYRAGIDPRRAAGSLSKGEIKKLTQKIKETLADAIAAGGSSLRDYVQADGKLGYFQHQFAVYGREGEKCPTCGKTCPGIQRITQAGRSTFFCPKKQK